jgi:hypothetical protein
MQALWQSGFFRNHRATPISWRSAFPFSFHALAEQNGCEFITADEKLVKKLVGKFSFLRWLGDL